MNMKKKHIILLLIAGCIITAVVLQLFEMNLTIRTILVTIFMVLLFAIRTILTMDKDNTKQ